MKGRVFAYKHIDGRTVKLAGADRKVAGARWGYEFTTRDPGTGKRRSISKAGFSGQREAERALRAALVEFDKVGQAPVDPVSTPLSTYIVDAWLPSVRHNLKPTTIENYEQLHRSYVAPHIGALQLRHVTPETLTALYATLSARGGRGGRPLADMTVHHVTVLLSNVLGFATEAGALKVNPARSIPKAARRKQPKRSPERLHYWTPAQAAQFVGATEGDRLGPLYRLALVLGLRRGELAGLQWRDLTLDAENGHPTVHVSRQLSKVGSEVVEQAPKTVQSARTIELDAETVALLRDHRKRQMAEQRQWATAWEGDGRGWVFTTENGHPLDPSSITNRLEGAAKRADVPWVGVHGLRHTCAVLLLSAGIPLKVVSERLGHTSASFTADLYQHVIPGMQHDASAAMSTMLRKASAE